MIDQINTSLQTLYKQEFNGYPKSITPLAQGGSDRRYFRLTNSNNSVIGAFNPDVDENRAFFYLTNHFEEKGIQVPHILRVAADEKVYLLDDLGDASLFDTVIKTDWESSTSESALQLLKRTLENLAKVQVHGAQGLDFSKCYPKSDFDLQSILWDFNYFKYCFLKPSGVAFNETSLDNDFLAFANVLLSQPTGYFQYRDFQSRNVMVNNNEPYFIDYQGGRRGPLLYDVASFLYQARANFPHEIRKALFSSYLDSVSSLTPVNSAELHHHLPIFALFRVIQTLGAYGYRGFFERRAHFLQSIPLAAENLKNLLSVIDTSILKLPVLFGALNGIAQKYSASTEQSQSFSGLTIEVNSFSYKKGYPAEHPEHGGGFVFDCRALPNPGRLNEYKMKTGLESSVIEYLEGHDEVNRFYQNVWDIVSKSVVTYVDRGFNHLSVSFGCTGGQHRSVYMANRFANQVKQMSDQIRVFTKHREINSDNY